MALPEITEPSTRPAPLRIPEASPAAFGANVGGAVSQLGEEMNAIAVNERHMAAQFDAQDRELKYGVEHDKLKQDYENSIRSLQSPDSTSFQEEATKLRDKFSQDQEALRAKYENTLKDPLARKAYQIRTRLQTQQAERQMMIFADAHVRAWRAAESDKKVALEEERAGNVSGDLPTDLQNLQLLRNSAHDAIVLQHLDGQPRAVADVKIRSADKQMALNVLKAYDEKMNHAAALGFLDAKLPDGTSVTYDPKKPDAPYLLTTAEAQAFKNKIIQTRNAKEGADLGEALYQESLTTKGFKLEQRLTELFNSGVSGDAIGKARQHFTVIQNDHFQQHEHGVALAYDAAYKIVHEKYKDNIDKAIFAAEGGADPQLRNVWNALGAKQGNLRAAFAREEKLDPAAYTPLGKVIDLAGTPGAISKKYPTFADFQAEFQGPTGHLWPQAVHLYEQDVKRDTSQDVHYQVFKNSYDDRVRSLTGWTQVKGSSARGYWAEADNETQAVHTWVTMAAEQAWADHQQSRKQTPGKASDATWFNQTLNEIIQQAQQEKKRGSFKKGGMPGLPATPESATTIKAQATAKPLPPGAAHYSPSTGLYYDKNGNPIPEVK